MTILPLDNGPVIIGAGLAGLATALSLDEPCTLLSAAPLGEGTSTGWAQGGIAAAVGPDDSPALHAADTIAAGDGLCDPDAVARIVAGGPDAIARLAAWGARFDREDGALLAGLEAAHSRPRIVHAAGDGTGREILRALLARARAAPRIRILERTVARELLRDADSCIAGVLVATASGTRTLTTSRVVIATGGTGGLFAETTNPLSAVGSGLALAARAGAVLADLEFVQFHPTAIDIGRDPMPLATEAIRGEGATLIDETGRRFVPELAPRDVVARAIAAELAAGHRVFLDARTALGERFARRFPAVDAICRAADLDPSRTPIPVRPAAHYAMGGIETDADGRTSVEGLWAVGEAAASGLHGANRLASNSLLEAAVMGAAVARDVQSRPAPRRTQRMIRLPEHGSARPLRPIRPILARGFGVRRDQSGMAAAARDLLALEGLADRDALTAALLIAAASLGRAESRGAHHRTDRPSQDVPVRSRLTLAQARDRLAPLALADRRRA